MAKSLTPGIAAHIAVIDGQPTTTTQDIADVYGKQHGHVLRIVRQRMAEAPEAWRLSNFGETVSERANPSGGAPIQSPVIRMTKKGFHFVVGKFTGAKAVQHQIAFVDEFERLTVEIEKLVNLAIPPDPVALHHCTPPVQLPPQCATAIQADSKPLQLPAQSHRLVPHALMADAVLTGMAAATMVQRHVTQAILKGTDDWVHHRYLVSFTESKRGHPPVVELLPADAQVLSQKQITTLMANAFASTWRELDKSMPRRARDIGGAV